MPKSRKPRPEQGKPRVPREPNSLNARELATKLATTEGTRESGADRRLRRAPSTPLEKAIDEFLLAAYETHGACWEAPTSILDLGSPTPRLDFESSLSARLLVARAIELRRVAIELSEGLAPDSVTIAARASLDAVQLVVQEDGSAWFDMDGSPSAPRQRQLSAVCDQAKDLLEPPFERLLQNAVPPADAADADRPTETETFDAAVRDPRLFMGPADAPKLTSAAQAILRGIPGPTEPHESMSSYLKRDPSRTEREASQALGSHLLTERTRRGKRLNERGAEFRGHYLPKRDGLKSGISR